MSATTIASLLTAVRRQLVEPVARFWSDAELKEIMRLGAVDLWGAIIDLHKDHYFKVSTDPVLRANGTDISSIPEDCFRVLLIEPADITQNASGSQTIFVPKKFNSDDFSAARTITAQDVTSRRIIYYDVTGEGSPIGPPKILTAPMLTADLRVRLVYTPMLTWGGDVNPIPGGSDNALKAWTVAFARAKETEDRQPDSGWLAVYATEKQTILTRLTPRQEQDVEVVEDLFSW
jgi:hypothetical protein